jgi:hypothetical protein
MFALDRLIFVGGLIEFAILSAAALVPSVLDWRGQLQLLSPMLRHLVWVYGAFIALVIAGFGVISVGMYAELASGSPLARWFCGFVATFWLARLGVQLFLFDPTPYLTRRLLKVGYHGLTVAFAYLGAVFAAAALLSR